MGHVHKFTSSSTSLLSFAAHSSASLLGGLVGGIHGVAILSSGLCTMMLDARRAEGRKALFSGRACVGVTKQSGVTVPAVVDRVVEASKKPTTVKPIQCETAGGTEQLKKPAASASLRVQQQKQNEVAAANRARTEAYRAKMRKMEEEREMARLRHDWKMMNLRQMKTAKEQEDFLAFIAIPPTLPRRDMREWQTDHQFSSAQAIERVVRSLTPAFDAAADREEEAAIQHVTAREDEAVASDVAPEA